MCLFLFFFYKPNYDHKTRSDLNPMTLMTKENRYKTEASKCEDKRQETEVSEKLNIIKGRHDNLTETSLIFKKKLVETGIKYSVLIEQVNY